MIFYIILTSYNNINSCCMDQATISQTTLYENFQIIQDRYYIKGLFCAIALKKGAIVSPYFLLLLFQVIANKYSSWPGKLS